jgi:hypothetical protein
VSAHVLNPFDLSGCKIPKDALLLLPTLKSDGEMSSRMPHNTSCQESRRSQDCNRECCVTRLEIQECSRLPRKPCLRLRAKAVPLTEHCGNWSPWNCCVKRNATGESESGCTMLD